MIFGPSTNAGGAVLAALVALSFDVDRTRVLVSGHGHMTSPRSRPVYAFEAGTDQSGISGVPPKEYCMHCLNNNYGVCGRSASGHDYDDFLDSAGAPMPWNSQDTFTEGEVILVQSHLATHHNGHMTLSACPMGRASTQACFDDPAHRLTFVNDPLHGMAADPNYPERGYYAGGQNGGIQDFQMNFKLPDGIYGNEVMLQWKYITANACSPPGYSTYMGPPNNYPDSYWTQNLPECVPPYPDLNGARTSTDPEQFWNCAEITVLPGSPTPPTPAPPTAAPPPPTTTTTAASPTEASGVGCCTIDFKDCSPTVAGECSSSKEMCEGPCDKHWLPNGAVTGCTAQWDPCSTSEECCGPQICTGNGQCLEDPNASPTPPPPPPPPPSPTTTTTTLPPEPCFSNNYKDCNLDGNPNSCTAILLDEGAQDNCVALWGDCSSGGSSCCAPLVCHGGSRCVPLEKSAAVTSRKRRALSSASAVNASDKLENCIPCDDVPALWMKDEGLDCATASGRIGSRCVEDTNWLRNRFCRKTCHDMGLGYDGDVCCEVSSE